MTLLKIFFYLISLVIAKLICSKSKRLDCANWSRESCPSVSISPNFACKNSIREFNDCLDFFKLHSKLMRLSDITVWNEKNDFIATAAADIYVQKMCKYSLIIQKVPFDYTYTRIRGKIILTNLSNFSTEQKGLSETNNLFLSLKLLESRRKYFTYNWN